MSALGQPGAGVSPPSCNTDSLRRRNFVRITLNDLPSEVLDHICRSLCTHCEEEEKRGPPASAERNRVSRNSLLALTRTNRRLHDIAERILYHRLGSERLSDFDCFISVISKLMLNPALAANVRQVLLFPLVVDSDSSGRGYTILRNLAVGSGSQHFPTCEIWTNFLLFTLTQSEADAKCPSTFYLFLLSLTLRVASVEVNMHAARPPMPPAAGWWRILRPNDTYKLIEAIRVVSRCSSALHLLEELIIRPDTGVQESYFGGDDVLSILDTCRRLKHLKFLGTHGLPCRPHRVSTLHELFVSASTGIPPLGQRIMPAPCRLSSLTTLVFQALPVSSGSTEYKRTGFYSLLRQIHCLEYFVFTIDPRLNLLFPELLLHSHITPGQIVSIVAELQPKLEHLTLNFSGADPTMCLYCNEWLISSDKLPYRLPELRSLSLSDNCYRVDFGE